MDQETDRQKGWPDAKPLGAIPLRERLKLDIDAIVYETINEDEVGREV